MSLPTIAVKERDTLLGLESMRLWAVETIHNINEVVDIYQTSDVIPSTVSFTNLLNPQKWLKLERTDEIKPGDLMFRPFDDGHSKDGELVSIVCLSDAPTCSFNLSGEQWATYTPYKSTGGAHLPLSHVLGRWLKATPLSKKLRDIEPDERQRPVIVDADRLGVFFGYTDTKAPLAGSLKLTAARKCRPFVACGGNAKNDLLELASKGPAEGSVISAVADIELAGVICVAECTANSVARWDEITASDQTHKKE